MMSTSTMPASKKAKTIKIKSTFITNSRSDYVEGTVMYVYEFDKSMVPGRVWKALIPPLFREHSDVSFAVHSSLVIDPPL